MTYLMLMFFPIIISWLLTKLAEVSHDLMRCWEWNHVSLAVRHHPRKHHKKKKARRPSKNKDQVRTFNHWPSLLSKLVVKLSTLYTASRWPSPSSHCPILLPLLQPLNCLTKSQESILTPSPLSSASTPWPQSCWEINLTNLRTSRCTMTQKWKE
jgi:hypothetical protein